MPTIYDNIENILSDELTNAFDAAYKADICVGYFNLRGWNSFENHVDKFLGGEDAQCRLIIGMHATPQQLIKTHYSKVKSESIDNQTEIRLKRELAQEFRTQLTLGYPSNADEKTLKKLADQLRAEKLVIKLFVAHSLHAKLYLIHRHDKFHPVLSYLGSSNLTFSGLSHQGELNVDVLDRDAANKLVNWFEERWEDRYCLDISKHLIDIIDESWAVPKPPYYIYLKIAYHLSHEAREGLDEFKMPVPKFADNTRNYFPDREAKKVEYPFDENDKTAPYAQLYSESIVSIIDALNSLRYGLRDYLNHAIKLIESVLHLRNEGKFCRIELKENEQKQPSIICSLGLI